MKTWVLAAVLGILGGFVAVRLTQSRVAEPPHRQERAFAPTGPITEEAISNRNPQLELSSIVTRQKEDSGDYFDPVLLKSNSVYLARVLKHLDIRWYESSPAKDTPECEAIRQLLAKEGVGVDGVGEAYNAAWDYSKALDTAKRMGQTDDVVAKMVRANAEERLRKKYGISNNSFFDNLFQITPHVFFGKKDLSKPSEGEGLLN